MSFPAVTDFEEQAHYYATRSRNMLAWLLTIGYTAEQREAIAADAIYCQEQSAFYYKLAMNERFLEIDLSQPWVADDWG